MLALIGMSLLLVWRHQANISKLLAGTESKLGQKAAPTPLGAAPFQPKAAWCARHGHAHKHKKGHH
jgi:glycerol-3-phosphate acyltransferase PlsY